MRRRYDAGGKRIHGRAGTSGGLADGFAACAQELSGMAERLDESAIDGALTAGCEIVQESVRSKIVQVTGTLREGIVIEEGFSQGFFGTSAVKSVGWAEIRRPAGSQDTTDVYGPVLEYSEKRRMRHMNDGFEESKDAAVGAMKDALDAAIGGE